MKIANTTGFRTYGWMILALAPACGGSGPGSGLGQGQGQGQGQGMMSSAALLEGKAQVGVSATAVSASRVESDGQLTALADAPAMVDASGRYRLAATVSAGAGEVIDQLLVTARAGAMTLGSVVVEGAFAANGDFKVPPIDAQSSAEANLLVNAKSSGQWGSDFTLGELRALLGDGGAASLGAAKADASAQKEAALTAIVSINAWRKMLAAEGATKAQLQATLQAVSAAQAKLDAQLDAAASADQKGAALAAFDAAFVTAHTDAGATIAQLSLAAHANADATAVYAASLDESLRAQVLARAEALRAARASAVIAADAQLVGADNAAQQALTTAGATLQSKIAASAQAGAAAQASVKAAWLEYAATVSAQLASSISLAANAKTALKGAIDSEVAKLVAARASLVATASASVTADAEASALAQFMVSGMSHSSLVTASGISAAKATAFVDATLQLDAATGVSQ